MSDVELKNKYSSFIAELSELLGLGKPVDILKLCAATDSFFLPLKTRIAALEKENEEQKVQIQNLKKDYELLLEEKFRLEDTISGLKECH